MRIKETLARVALLAAEAGGTELEESPVLDTQLCAELIMPRAMQIIAEEAMATPEGVNALRRNHSLQLAAGSVVLPPSVMVKYSEAFYLNIGTSVHYSSLEKDYFGFSADEVTALVPKFYIEDNVLHFQSSTSALGTSTLAVTLNAPTVPRIPRASLAITNIDSSSPRVVTTATHGLAVDDYVFIHGVAGLDFNGRAKVLSVPSGTTFTTDLPDGTGAWTNPSGSVEKPPDYDTTEIDFPDYLTEKLVVLLAGLVTEGSKGLIRLGLDPKSMKLKTPL